MLIPPPPWQIRPMQLDDIDAVLKIEQASFPTAWTTQGYAYELAENKMARYSVLTHDTVGLVGYAGYWLLADEVHISIIAVEPTWRGRGLGELLLLNMLFAAYPLNAQLATLEVRRSNESAQSLYRKYGFEEVGLRRRYYHDNGEDACIMTIQPLDEAYREWLVQNQVALWARLQHEQGQQIKPRG